MERFIINTIALFAIIFISHCSDQIQSIGKNAQEELERIVKEDAQTGGVSGSTQNDYSASSPNPYGSSSNLSNPQDNGSNWVNGTTNGASGTPSAPAGNSTFGGVTGAKPKEKSK
jgi:hypothetical protein